MIALAFDTVSVITMERVNAQLAAHPEAVLTGFSFSSTVATPFSGPYTCSGSFGAWSVLPGGTSVDYLFLGLPITGGSLAAGDAAVDLTGLVATMQVSLDLLPDPADQGAQALAFAFRSAATLGATPAPGVVVPISLGGPQAVLDQLGAGGRQELLDGLAAQLCQNAAAISFVFARLNLVAMDSTGWLAPRSSTYAALSSGAPSRDFLCILSMVGDRPSAGVDRVVDAAILPGPGCDASFAFSGDLFMVNMILPSLPQAFGGDATEADFVYDASQQQINAVRHISMSPIVLTAGGIKYVPVVTAATVAMSTQALQIDCNGTCDMKAGVSMKFDAEDHPALVLDVPSQTIAFVRDPNPGFHDKVHVSGWWSVFYIQTQEIAQSVGLALSKRIANAINIQTLQRIHPGVAWTGVSGFTASSVRLDQTFVLYGNAG